MAIVVGVLLAAVLFFVALMWVRLVFDWIRVLRPSWRPRGIGLVLAESSYAVTDPPVRAVRRIVPPLGLGAMRLDFSWSIVMLVCLAILWIIGLA